MTLLSPSLSDMPHHILQQIATYTNERTIWATMATSRAFREAGEKALKGHLAQKAITAYPPFMLNDFEAISPITDTEQLKDRVESLHKRSTLFNDHLVAYPLSESLLKHLTVEVIGGEYDWEEPGWAEIKKALPQLERLNVCILEPVREERGVPSDCDSEDSYWVREEEERNRPFETWRDIQSKWMEVIEKRDFPNLTTLVIHTTIRVLEHLEQICKHAPNVRHLTLGAHWSNSDLLDLGYFSLDGDLVNIPKMSQLEDIVIIGGVGTILNALTVLLYPPHSIRYVTIRALDLPPADTDDDFPLFGTGSDIPISERHPIQGLALHGIDAYNLFASVIFEQKHVELHATFQHITVLILERVSGSGKKERKYPLLGHNVSQQILLPRLSRIIWVDLQKNKHGAYTHGTLDPTGTSEFYTEEALRAVFDRYEALQQVQFVAGYPIDPFAEDDPPTWTERNVRCVVDRPADEKSALQPIRPPFLSSN